MTFFDQIKCTDKRQMAGAKTNLFRPPRRPPRGGVRMCGALRERQSAEQCVVYSYMFVGTRPWPQVYLKKECSPVYHVLRKCYNKAVVLKISYLYLSFLGCRFKVVAVKCFFENFKLLFLKFKVEIFLFLKPVFIKFRFKDFFILIKLLFLKFHFKTYLFFKTVVFRSCGFHESLRC